MKPWSQHEEPCRTPPPLLWQGHSRADITHNTLSCLFPWCNKRCRTKKKKSARVQSCPLSQQAKFDVRVCRSVTHQESDEPPGLQSGPRERREEGNNCPLIKVPVKTIAELTATRVYRRIWTCQATAPGALMVLRYFKPTNFLFSTPASAGWYEVLASVHQPSQRSSQANKKSNCNSRLVEFMNEFRSFESSVSDLLSPGRCWMNSVQSEKRRFLCPIIGNKSTLPMLSPCYISSICGAQCTPGVPLQGDLIQLFGRVTFSQSVAVGDFFYISPEGLKTNSRERVWTCELMCRQNNSKTLSN